MQKIWNEQKIISELEVLIREHGHFPLYEELRPMGKGGLARAISKSGGINKYHELLGIPTNYAPTGYWTEERCISELEKVIKNIGHFPTQIELKSINRQDLIGGLDRNGGLTKFRELMGYEIDKQPNGYWTEYVCAEELKKVITDIGHFPSQDELVNINRTDLTNAIKKNGGLNKFRNILGYDYIKVPKDYWTKDRCIEELTRIIRIIEHFPSHEEINKYGRKGFGSSIVCKYGGINNIRKEMGFPDLNLSELYGYYSRHGKKAEDIVYQILSEYCQQKKINIETNVKLCEGNVIEFICGNINKKIGIDITITKRKDVVINKWTKKEYYNHLDELWIVVINDIFTEEDYDILNRNSPENVYVMSIDNFIEELQYDLTESMKDKVENYKKCNFHNRTNNKLINK